MLSKSNLDTLLKNVFLQLNIIPGSEQVTPQIRPTHPTDKHDPAIKILFSHLPLIPGVQKSVIEVWGLIFFV